MRATTRIAIANAVVNSGGNADDLADLLDVWRRVERVNGERADRIRAQTVRAAQRLDEMLKGEVWR